MTPVDISTRPEIVKGNKVFEFIKATLKSNITLAGIVLGWMIFVIFGIFGFVAAFSSPQPIDTIISALSIGALNGTTICLLAVLDSAFITLSYGGYLGIK